MVQFFHYSDERLVDVARILDGKGRLRFEVRHSKLVGPLDEYGSLLMDFNGDGVPELRILGWSGGAYCCYTEYLFDLRGGLKNILIYRGGEYHLFKGNEFGGGNPENDPVRYLEGRRKPLLVSENDAIQHVNGSAHGPTTVLALEWDGSRYVNATKRYPQLPRSRSIRYRDLIPLDSDGRFKDELTNSDLAAGYYANALLAGDEKTARAWLGAWRGSHGGMA